MLKLIQFLIINVDLGGRIVLHPGQFILGSTLEFIKLPDDLLGYVMGRSSWGRLGLVIATATTINPGYARTITLELANLGTVPITLYPGTRICQLVLHESISKDKPKKSKYQISVGPQFSKIYSDEEWGAFKKILESNTISKNLPIR